MQITDLLVPERVALNMQVADKAMAIHAMVGMLDRTGCLRDAVEYEKNVLEREAQGTTGVGGGVAIPHGKSNAVLVPALAAVTLREAIDYQALDGAPVRLLFLIAAPDGANDLHIQVLARLAQLLMEPLFCEELKQAATPEEFLAVIAKREQGETAREARAEAVAEAALTEPRLAPRVLAVTACPTGIAHTYMAAEALESAAKAKGWEVKVETNGADGVKNHLTEQEIENAECIIVAADKAVETARFAGKPVLRVPVSQALKDPEMLLHRALSGTAPLEPEDESVPGMGCNRKAGSAKDGAAATQPLAVVEVLQGGLLDGFVVEAVVLHEALVLAGDHRHGHRARHTFQRNPLVVETDGTAIGDLLEATREHERREIDRHKAIGHHREQRGGEEQGQGQTDYLEYLFHHIRLQRYKEKSKWI